MEELQLQDLKNMEAVGSITVRVKPFEGYHYTPACGGRKAESEASET